MPGHLEKRGDKSWYIIVEAGRDPITKKRKRIKQSFQGKKGDAEKEMARLVTELEKGTYIEPGKTTVSEYLLWWVEQHSIGKNLAPKTIVSYRQIITLHLIPALGNIPLSKLQPMHIQQFVNQMLQKRSPRTVAYNLTVLKQALKHAVQKWRLIPYNPTDAVERPSYRRVKFQALSIEEVEVFLNKVRDHKDYPIIYTALYTGMRQGELLGLHWDDVDLNRGVIKVQRTAQWVTGLGRIEKPPKTEAGRREVDLPATVINLFRETKKQQAENRLFMADKYQDNNLVFCQGNGKAIDNSNLTRRFRRLADAKGYEDLRFHDLRHTHASLMLAAGEQLHVVQQRLGHEKPSTTADIYGHAIPGQQRAAADRFDNLFGHQMGTKTSRRLFSQKK